MWVTTSELADSVKPDGELSNTVVEIGVYVLQQSCRDNSKVIFPWIATSYLLDHNFHSNVLKKHFRKDDKYKLSHKNLVRSCSFIFLDFPHQLLGVLRFAFIFCGLYLINHFFPC